MEFKRLLVTPNCDAAIRYLRYEVTSRILWIDAISINQQDFGEKNTQVQMMGEIYAGASRALVWLGEDSSFSRSQSYIDIWANLMQQVPVFASHITEDADESEAREKALINLGGSFISNIGRKIGDANGRSLSPLPFLPTIITA